MIIFYFNQCSIFTECCVYLWKRFEWSKLLFIKFPPVDKKIFPQQNFPTLPLQEMGWSKNIGINIWAKVFKNGQSKICGRQPLKNVRKYGFLKADHTPSNFLKAAFQKFYLVYSWKLCPIYSLLVRSSNIHNTRYQGSK